MKTTIAVNRSLAAALCAAALALPARAEPFEDAVAQIQTLAAKAAESRKAAAACAPALDARTLALGDRLKAVKERVAYEHALLSPGMGRERILAAMTSRLEADGGYRIEFVKTARFGEQTRYLDVEGGLWGLLTCSSVRHDRTTYEEREIKVVVTGSLVTGDAKETSTVLSSKPGLTDRFESTCGVSG